MMGITIKIADEEKLVGISMYNPSVLPRSKWIIPAEGLLIGGG